MISCFHFNLLEEAVLENLLYINYTFSIVILTEDVSWFGLLGMRLLSESVGGMNEKMVKTNAWSTIGLKTTANVLDCKPLKGSVNHRKGPPPRSLYYNNTNQILSYLKSSGIV